MYIIQNIILNLHVLKDKVRHVYYIVILSKLLTTPIKLIRAQVFFLLPYKYL